MKEQNLYVEWYFNADLDTGCGRLGRITEGKM